MRIGRKLRLVPMQSQLSPLLTGWPLLVWAKEQRDHAIQDQTNPEIDRHAQVWKQAHAAMLGRRRQMRHDEEIDGVPQHHGRKRDEEVPREAHSHSLDT